MKRRKSIADQFAEGAAAGAKLSVDAEKVFEARDVDNRRGTVRALADIRPRPGGNSREIDSRHVADLAESIAAVGLVEPIAVDRRGHLLAGGHRLAALRILAAAVGDRGTVAADLLGDVSGELVERLAALPENVIDGGAVPVAVVDIDAEEEPARALSIEIAENEKRRDYSRAEVVTLAERLKRAGFRDKPGRPKPGEKVLSVALGVIVGKSRRSVFRMLAGETVPSGTVSDRATSAAVALGRSIGRYLEAARGDRRRAHQRLAQKLRELGEDVEAASGGSADE